MLAIEEWGAAKFKPIVMLAHVVATSAEECHKNIIAARAPSKLLPKDCAPTKWLRLYRQPLRVEAALWQFLCYPDKTDEFESFIAQQRWLQHELTERLRNELCKALTTGINQREHERALRAINRFYSWVHLPMMQQWVSETDRPPSGIERWLYCPDFMFLLAVAMPCWLEYHQTPWELYLRAWQGDFQALEQLGRLDSEVDKDDCLKVVVFRLRNQNPGQYELFQAAKLQGLKSPITLRDVKYSLGGLLMRWSKEMQSILRWEPLFRVLPQHTNPAQLSQVRKWIKAARAEAERSGVKCWLKAPDIQALFNAIAIDTGKGFDPDFDREPDSIYKRLRRNARLWPSLQETDKKRAA